MNDIKVKICGVRTLEAAHAAVDSGADYLGFNFVPKSRRYIDPAHAAEIIKQIKGTVQTVGVFQNADRETVTKVARQLDLAFVQLHGEEDAEYIRQMGSHVIKAIHSFDEAAAYSVDYFLLDRTIQGKGAMVDSNMAKALASRYSIFLAGGLTPENVADIVKQVKPFAVDVAGGIETDGLQDTQKIKDFIENVKGAVVV